MSDQPLTDREKIEQEKSQQEKSQQEQTAPAEPMGKPDKPGKLNLKPYMIKVQGGRLYLPVSARLVAFRHDHPDWSIKTIPFQLDWEKQWAVFACEIRDANGNLMATGHKREDVRGFGDFMEKSETGSIGRALGILGYGTEYLTEFDEVTPEQAAAGDGRFADSPKQPPQRPQGHGKTEQGQEGQNRPQRPPQRPQEAVPPACEECGKALTKGQAELSVRNFGRQLCHSHQRDQPRQAPASSDKPERPINENGDSPGQVGAVQGKITQERKRIWGTTEGADAAYRIWLDDSYHLRSLANQPLRFLNEVLLTLREMPVEDDPFEDTTSEMSADN